MAISIPSSDVRTNASYTAPLPSPPPTSEELTKLESLADNLAVKTAVLEKDADSFDAVVNNKETLNKLKGEIGNSSLSADDKEALTIFAGLVPSVSANVRAWAKKLSETSANLKAFTSENAARIMVLQGELAEKKAKSIIDGAKAEFIGKVADAGMQLAGAVVSLGAGFKMVKAQRVASQSAHPEAQSMATNTVQSLNALSSGLSQALGGVGQIVKAKYDLDAADQQALQTILTGLDDFHRRSQQTYSDSGGQTQSLLQTALDLQKALLNNDQSSSPIR